LKQNTYRSGKTRARRRDEQAQRDPTGQNAIWSKGLPAGAATVLLSRARGLNRISSAGDSELDSWRNSPQLRSFIRHYKPGRSEVRANASVDPVKGLLDESIPINCGTPWSIAIKAVYAGFGGVRNTNWPALRNLCLP
jgi:hypothetical protein